jgi:ribonucleotide reductase alpha subunit
MSSYSSYHKKYYESKKEEILQRNKDNNYWKNYYEINKEKIKEKAKIRYLKKKELESIQHFNQNN